MKSLRKLMLPNLLLRILAQRVLLYRGDKMALFCENVSVNISDLICVFAGLCNYISAPLEFSSRTLCFFTELNSRDAK